MSILERLSKKQKTCLGLIALFLVAAIVFYFACMARNLMITYVNDRADTITPELINGSQIEQKFVCPVNHLTQIVLMPATLEQNLTKGNILISLNDDKNNLVQNWIIPADKIIDNQKIVLDLSEQPESSGKIFNLVIIVQDFGKQSFRLWIDQQPATGSDLYINSQKNQDTGLYMEIGYWHLSYGGTEAYFLIIFTAIAATVYPLLPGQKKSTENEMEDDSHAELME